jgi:hypothetical protein
MDSDKALEIAQKVGKFVATHIGGTVEQGMGIYEDKLKYYRAVNQLRFIAKYNEIANELRLPVTAKPVPLKLAIPLLEAASLEDDDYLQNMWVNLLLNASNEQNRLNIQRSHINILEQLNTFEAKCLEAIYSVSELIADKGGVISDGLPDKAKVVSERAYNNGEVNLVDPNDEVKLALANLARLRLISLPMVFGGGELYKYTHHSLLGKRFVEACTISL